MPNQGAIQARRRERFRANDEVKPGALKEMDDRLCRPFARVQTYGASGNVVFASNAAQARVKATMEAKLRALTEQGIAFKTRRKFGHPTRRNRLSCHS